MALTGVNVASCYWSLFKYAKYFAQRHPKVVEDERAVEVVVRLEGKSSRHHAEMIGDDKMPAEPHPVVVNTNKRVSFIEDMV